MLALLKAASGPQLAIGAAIALAVAAGAGFGSGWMVNGWRLGATIERQKAQINGLQAQAALLRQANERCAIDVEGVRKAVQGVVDAAAARAAKAEAAMRRAEANARGHLSRAEAILKAGKVPADLASQCAAIIHEQRIYVQERKEGR